MIKLIIITITLVFWIGFFTAFVYFLEYYVKPVLEELLELFKNSW